MNTNAYHDPDQDAGAPGGALGATTLEIERQLAGFVASLLRGRWHVEVTRGRLAGEGSVFLNGPDTARLRVSLDLDRADRVRITGIYPEHGRLSITHVSITVGRDRGPGIIAREIERRLLVKYLPELARARARNRQRTRQSRAREALIRDLLTRLSVHGSDASCTGQARVGISVPGGPLGYLDLDASGEHALIYLNYVSRQLLLDIATLIGPGAQSSTTPPP